MTDVSITIRGGDWTLAELDELTPGAIVSVGGRPRMLTAITPVSRGWLLHTACGQVIPCPQVVRSASGEQVRMLIPVLSGVSLPSAGGPSAL